MRTPILFATAALAVFGQGSSYRWIRQFGGSLADPPVGIAIDVAGNTYIAGSTSSPDFPTKNAIQDRPGGVPLYRIDGLTPAKIYNTREPSILGVAFSPCDTQTVFAVSFTSLLRSVDLGTTWTSTPLPTTTVPSSIAAACVAPSTPVVYIAAGTMVFRSRDLTTWDSADLSAGTVSTILADPNAPTTLYARTAMGLARSADGGDHWRLTGISTFDLTFDPRHPGTIYAPLIYFGANTLDATPVVPGKSTDFGITWTALYAIPGRDNYPRSIVADPAREGVLYAAGSGLFESTDSGNTWTSKPLPVSNPLVADYDTKTIYATSNAGVVATRDGFNTIAKVSPSGIVISSVAVSHGVAFASALASSDVFIVKLDPEGEVVFSTYFGGSAYDTPSALAVGADGSIYITGHSSSGDFPTTPAALQAVAPAQGSVFLFKLNPDGTLNYSTFFSGSYANNISPSALAVDADGNAIIAGTTSGGLPVTPGAYQTDFKGTFITGSIVPFPSPTNAYATKFRSGGSALLYSTYLGSQSDTGRALVLAPDGSVYVGGARNIFHLSADGSKLLASAPAQNQNVTSMAIDNSGGLYTVGLTTPAGVQSVTRWSADLQPGAVRPLPGVTNAQIALAGERVLISGSATPNMPTVAPFQSAFSPLTGFVSELFADLSDVWFSTFAGDRNIFSVAGAAATQDGDIVFTGSTQRSSFAGNSYYPFPPSPDTAGGTVYAARLTPLVPQLRLDSIANAASLLANPLAANETVIVRGRGFGAAARVLVDGQPLAILSRATDRIIAIIPAGFRTDGTARVQVESAGDVSNPVLMPIAAASPGLFSVDGSGLGQGYIQNADGTSNSPSNPAAEGDPITLFLTGASPDLAVAVYIDGFYANGIGETTGGVDGLPGQVYKLSVFVPRPSDLAAQNPNLKNFKMPPTVPVQVVMGTVKSQVGLTLSVR